MDKGDVHASVPIASDQTRGQRGGLVGGIVQDLNLEAILWVIQTPYHVNEPLDDIGLVVDRDLHRDARPLLGVRMPGLPDRRIALEHPVAGAVMQHNHPIAIQAKQQEKDSGDHMESPQQSVQHRKQ